MSYMKPEKVFNPYVTDSVFVRAYQLYNEHRDYLYSLPHFQKSNIYFVVERQKVRFIPSEMEINPDGVIKFVFDIAGRSLEYMDHLVQIMLRRWLGDNAPTDFQSTIICGTDHSQIQHNLQRLNPSFTAGIVLDLPTSNAEIIPLAFYTNQGLVSNGALASHAILQELRIDIGDFSKILYVGQSKKIQRRAVTHEKIQQALAERSSNADIYLYFFQFSENQFTVNHPINNIQLIQNSRPIDISHKGKTNLVEMALINYFKPIYNRNFVEADISSNQQVKTLLRANGYTKMVMEVIHDDVFWKFGSEMIAPATSHTIVYDL